MQVDEPDILLSKYMLKFCTPSTNAGCARHAKIQAIFTLQNVEFIQLHPLRLCHESLRYITLLYSERVIFIIFLNFRNMWGTIPMMTVCWWVLVTTEIAGKIHFKKQVAAPFYREICLHGPPTTNNIQIFSTNSLMY